MRCFGVCTPNTLTLIFFHDKRADLKTGTMKHTRRVLSLRGRGGREDRQGRRRLPARLRSPSLPLQSDLWRGEQGAAVPPTARSGPPPQAEDSDRSPKQESLASRGAFDGRAVRGARKERLTAAEPCPLNCRTRPSSPGHAPQLS